jgi:MFS family permease
LFDRLFRNLLLICLATAAWSYGFGAGSQLVSQWMNQHGADKTQIGLGHSCYYLGLAVASLAVPWLNRRFGTRAAGVGMIVCGPALAFFPWAGGPLGWYALRLLSGAASALSLIPLETMISRDAPAGERARNFAFYGVSLTLGGALGMWVGLNLFELAPVVAFGLGAAAPFGGGLAVLFGLSGRCAEVPRGVPAPILWRTRFLSFGTAWSQGFLEGGMLAFLALYLETRGLAVDEAGDLIGLTTVGILLFQVPISWLADRCGRIRVLLGCYAVVIGGLIAAPFCPNTPLLAICLFVFGGCAGAMYPLGLALLGDGLASTSLARLYAWYLAMECVGSLMGPPAMGSAIDAWGSSAMFSVGIVAVALVIASWIAFRKNSAPRSIPLAESETPERRQVA